LSKYGEEKNVNKKNMGTTYEFCENRGEMQNESLLTKANRRCATAWLRFRSYHIFSELFHALSRAFTLSGTTSLCACALFHPISWRFSLPSCHL